MKQTPQQTRVVASLYSSFAEGVGSPDLFTSLALGYVEESPFVPDDIKELEKKSSTLSQQRG